MRLLSDRLIRVGISREVYIIGDVLPSHACQCFFSLSTYLYSGAADHSTPFVIVMALLHGSFTPAVYEGKPWLRHDVIASMDKIKLIIDPQYEQQVYIFSILIY